MNFGQITGMEITAYVVEEGRFKPLNVSAPDQIPTGVVWVDVREPTIEEAANLAADLGLHLEFDESALTLQLYGHVEVEGDQLAVLLQTDRPEPTHDPATSWVLVLVSSEKLVTFRRGSVPAMEATIRAVPDMAVGPQPRMQVIIRILSNANQATSRILDVAEAEVDQLSQVLFSATRSTRAEIDLENLLTDLGPMQARMVELRYRQRLISRVVQILKSHPGFALTPDLQEDLDLEASDVVGLTDFAQSVEDQLSRLMDATIGFIGIRQNASARWFSIVATIFMPPTLLAAVWGMNFENMPELDDKYAYAFALVLMLLSATVPLWIVRKMGLLGR